MTQTSFYKYNIIYIIYIYIFFFLIFFVVCLSVPVHMVVTAAQVTLDVAWAAFEKKYISELIAIEDKVPSVPSVSSLTWLCQVEDLYSNYISNI